MSSAMRTLLQSSLGLLLPIILPSVVFALKGGTALRGIIEKLGHDRTRAGIRSSSSLTNFPMLVFGDGRWDLAAGAQSNANDILFTAADGVTKLNPEIEGYTSSTGQLVAWVQIPTLSTSADTTIYVYYGNAAVGNQENKAERLRDSNFTGVWHFPNVSGAVGLNDSTFGAHTLTNANQLPTAASGEVGSGAQFNGTNQALSTSLDLSATNVMTVSFWIELGCLRQQ